MIFIPSPDERISASHYVPCALFLQLHEMGITFLRYLEYPYKYFAILQLLETFLCAFLTKKILCGENVA